MSSKKVLMVLVLSLNSCSLFVEPMPKGWDRNFIRPLTGVRGYPSTDSEYGKGFKDGCGTAWDAVSKGLLSDINEKKFDYRRMQKSGDYGNGWWDGYEQCTYTLDWDVI